jgi:hypothetical protein
MTSSHTLVGSSHRPASTASHGHGHETHVAPWEGVNLWRTPFKGDADTVTQVKRNQSMLDRYVDNRTRRIQQMQLFALVNSSHLEQNTPVIVVRELVCLFVCLFSVRKQRPHGL